MSESTDNMGTEKGNKDEGKREDRHVRDNERRGC